MVVGGGASRDASRPAAHMRAAEMAKVPRDVACPSTGLVQYLPPSRAALSKRWTDRCETPGVQSRDPATTTKPPSSSNRIGASRAGAKSKRRTSRKFSGVQRQRTPLPR